MREADEGTVRPRCGGIRKSDLRGFEYFAIRSEEGESADYAGCVTMN